MKIYFYSTSHGFSTILPEGAKEEVQCNAGFFEGALFLLIGKLPKIFFFEMSYILQVDIFFFFLFLKI
ncbi:unnamed protein product [Nezara viridula]|uniref:Uncharacterized protein n=1 Tax=Nezara viridula TaxID=85310 RepID=A0A9P0E477_NEZVI|nr:unnamed protein product [Nezara viridula]